MSSEPAPDATSGARRDDPTRIGDLATALVRIYARAFLAQGAGLVGLAWCLDRNLPGVALGLAALVLVDQAIFLRGRAALPGAVRLQRGLDIWCLFVSCTDILLVFAALFRVTGLREGVTAVSDPLNCLAFAVATLARLDLGLVPADGAGRLVAATEALLGDAVLLLAVAALVRAALRRLPGVTHP